MPKDDIFIDSPSAKRKELLRKTVSFNNSDSSSVPKLNLSRVKSFDEEEEEDYYNPKNLQPNIAKYDTKSRRSIWGLIKTKSTNLLNNKSPHKISPSSTPRIETPKRKYYMFILIIFLYFKIFAFTFFNFLILN